MCERDSVCERACERGRGGGGGAECTRLLHCRHEFYLPNIFSIATVSLVLIQGKAHKHTYIPTHLYKHTQSTNVYTHHRSSSEWPGNNNKVTGNMLLEEYKQKPQDLHVHVHVHTLTRE